MVFLFQKMRMVMKFGNKEKNYWHRKIELILIGFRLLIALIMIEKKVNVLIMKKGQIFVGIQVVSQISQGILMNSIRKQQKLNL